MIPTLLPQPNETQVRECLFAAGTCHEAQPQKAPPEQAICIRLSVDVLQALRATGPGWRARVDDLLRAEFVGN